MLALMGLGGALIVLFSTVWGSGISPDSAMYIAGARNLIQGQGISFTGGDGTPVAITLWPPLYPMLLALGGVVGNDPVAAARWINSILFATNIFIVGWSVYRLTHDAPAPTLVAGGLFLSSLTFVTLHAWTWSEPLFLALSMTGLLSIQLYFWRGKSTTLLIAATCAGLATMARFAGIAVIGTGMALFLADRGSDLKRRLTHMSAYLAISATPLLLWLGRNSVVAGSLTDRDIGYSAIDLGAVRQAYYTAASWFLPTDIDIDIRKLAFLAAILLAAGILTWLWAVQRKQARSSPSDISARFKLPIAYLLFAIFSAVTVILSKAFFDSTIPFNDRIMSPIFIAGILFGVIALQRLYQRIGNLEQASKSTRSKGRLLLILIYAVALAYMLILQIGRSWRWSSRANIRGLGYASKSWHNAESIGLVRNLPESTPIFSNAPEAINVLTDHPAYFLPPAPGSEGTDRRFQAEFEFMEELLLEQAGLIIYFDQITWRDLVTDEELLSILPLETVLMGQGEAVYRLGE
jgi:hypothetical protein